MKRVDITGRKFGRLTALNEDHKHNGQEYWFCECKCGGTNVVRKSHLTGGRIRSCGCLYRQKRGVSEPCSYESVDGVVYGTDFKGNKFLFDEDDLERVSQYIDF